MAIQTGHPALIRRHRPFTVTRVGAERYLYHMQNALDTTENIDPDSKIKMMNYFRFVCLPICGFSEANSFNISESVCSFLSLGTGILLSFLQLEIK